MTSLTTTELSSPHTHGTRRTLLLTPELLLPAVAQAFKMLNPRVMMRNPVMFVTEVGSAVTTLVTIQAAVTGEGDLGYFAFVTALLWLTVVFANFAEALAEARSKAQAASLRKARKDVVAKKLSAASRDADVEQTAASKLAKGDIVLVEAGDYIPLDGEVVEGWPAWMKAPSPAKARR